MPRQITAATSVDTLRKTAKLWLKALHAHDPDARARLERAYPKAPAEAVLRDVQHALAREYGYDNWVLLTKAVRQGSLGEAGPPPTSDTYDRLANDLVLAHASKDEAALARLNAHYKRAFSFDDLWAYVWRQVYAFRQRAFSGSGAGLLIDEAKLLVAQAAGYGSWEALLGAQASGQSPVPPYEIDTKERSIEPRRLLTVNEWEALLGAAHEHGVTALHAGTMTDAMLARVADLHQVTSLHLGGSRELSDDGLQQLARMPQLERLNLSEYPGGHLTDRGLEVLRHLPNLRVFEMTWQRGITDAGAANLKFCERLERVDLMGTPTGDGAIEALQGKPQLRSFSTGRLVTDPGLALLQNFPRFKHAAGLDPDDKNGGRLLIDGPFTDSGLASLAGLEGVLDLDLFWHVSGITSDGFAHLIELPNLRSLGADGRLSDDRAMVHIASIPRLRDLRIQETAATDAGFEALSRSRSVESIWGRDCAHLGNRGFLALSRMPALKRLGVSCKNVEDRALATLPDFPALRELTPIGMQDEGFRHVGRCQRLERLTCMYCRDTTDVATAHIAGLAIGYYYAGLTQITDRSLEILGRMSSLEEVALYECKGVTDAGVAFLVALPRLREVHLDGLPGVTFSGAHVFPSHVRVKYST